MSFKCEAMLHLLDQSHKWRILSASEVNHSNSRSRSDLDPPGTLRLQHTLYTLLCWGRCDGMA